MDESAKHLILAIVENKLFNTLFDSMKQDVARAMIEEMDVERLSRYRDEVLALKRLEGKLTEIANDVRMSR